VRPALTAVAVAMYRVAQRATEILLASIDEEERDAHETLDAELVVRGSSS
jgi:DNA-binding LacI/PurR family transcriptional regulator